MQHAFDRSTGPAEGLVAIFPRGRLTADGEIAAFRRGVERIVERAPGAPGGARCRWHCRTCGRACDCAARGPARMADGCACRAARAHASALSGPPGRRCRCHRASLSRGQEPARQQPHLPTPGTSARSAGGRSTPALTVALAPRRVLCWSDRGEPARASARGCRARVVGPASASKPSMSGRNGHGCEAR